MVDHVGQRFGDYRLIRFLGEGTFGNVYFGEHVYQKTPAAIKVFKAKLTPDKLKDFINEVRTILLRHPNIVPVLDFGIEQGDVPFIVMEYAPNGTLRQRHPRGTRLLLTTIVTYVKQIAAALQYAHDQRRIHRDVKPENMLLGAKNLVLLSDFGIAVVAHNPGSQGIEEKSGTAAYMAPEQWKGKPLPASDQYALGILVYEWLCGERPFHGDVLQLQYQHTTVPAPPLREKIPMISPAVEQVAMRTLAKDPDQRFASVQDFADALEQAGKLQQVPQPKPSPAPVVQPSPQPVQPVQPIVPEAVDALYECLEDLHQKLAKYKESDFLTDRLLFAEQYNEGEYTTYASNVHDAYVALIKLLHNIMHGNHLVKKTLLKQDVRRPLLRFEETYNLFRYLGTDLGFANFFVTWDVDDDAADIIPAGEAIGQFGEYLTPLTDKDIEELRQQAQHNVRVQLMLARFYDYLAMYNYRRDNNPDEQTKQALDWAEQFYVLNDYENVLRFRPREKDYFTNIADPRLIEEAERIVKAEEERLRLFLDVFMESIKYCASIAPILSHVLNSPMHPLIAFVGKEYAKM